jgi:hypothetical protein
MKQVYRTTIYFTRDVARGVFHLAIRWSADLQSFAERLLGFVVRIASAEVKIVGAFADHI